MIINGNYISIFSGRSIYSKVVKEENKFTLKYPSLIRFLNDSRESAKKEYYFGDAISDDNRFFNYKKNIAVILNENDTFKIQFLEDGHVGKYFEDIYAEKEEIIKEFARLKDDLSVVENCGKCRNITNDPEKIFEYLSLLDETRKEVSLKQQPLIDALTQALSDLGDKTDLYAGNEITRRYNDFLGLGYGFLNEMCSLAGEFNKLSNEKMEEFFVPVDAHDRVYTTFGLFLYALKYGKSNKILTSSKRHYGRERFLNMLYEFNDFLVNNPNIVEEYAKYKGLDCAEKNEIMNLLEKENLYGETSTMFAANDILD